MKIAGYTFFEKAEVSVAEETPIVSEPKSFLMGNEMVASGNVNVRSYSFDGEKTRGELGNPINLLPDYNALRFRAYEAELISDVVKIITGKFFKWVVGSGLKLQAEPNSKVLTLEKAIKDSSDLVEFRSNSEAYFSLYADSKECDYSGMLDLHELAANAYETAFLGGDCLVVLRLDDNFNVTIQVVDGQHIATPIFDQKFIEEAKNKGNKIKHGIEINKNNKHVAFYVKKDSETMIPTFERIEAVSSTSGCLMAWMVYGKKHRIDHKRGISQLTAIIEKVTKLDRFTEASVSSAEERAKVPWTIEHSRFSDGENPLTALKTRLGSGDISESSFVQGDAIAKNITKTENKQVWNMPIDAKMKALESNAETKYAEFFDAIFVQLCASIDMPPEVALQKYNSNYSASRAAINGWGYIVNINRKKHSNDFYQPVYNLWLYVHILKSKINAPGYINALDSKNTYVTSSYSKARFTGANMPHIDPKKEADAIRIMLGDPAIGEAPLMTREQAAEQLGLGDWSENYKKYLEEEKLIVVPKPIENADSTKTKK